MNLSFLLAGFLLFANAGELDTKTNTTGELAFALSVL